MRLLFTALACLISVSSFGQQVDELVDESFNGFPPDNFIITTDYGSWPGNNWELDDWPFEWRLESTEISQWGNADGSNFLIGGNVDGAVTYTPDHPVTIFEISEINTTLFDSVLISFDSFTKLFASNSISFNRIEISNNQIDWYTIWSLFSDLNEDDTFIEFGSYSINTSYFQNETVYIRFIHSGVMCWALDNLKVIGYSALLGCMDEVACNFIAEATEDDGSCWFAEMYYNCDGSCINDDDGDGICNEFEISGCTSYEACNYDVTATDDNASCIFVGDPCDDGDPNTLDDEIQEDCECAGTPISTVDELEALSVLIYPNPASNNLTVDLGDLNGVNTTIKLYDASSKLVFEKESTSTLMIDVSGFAKGMYSLELATDEQVLRSQVIIE